MQAAPNSHKVIFDNEFVCVHEVTTPPAGMTEPMHHHRWPSFFLNWDTGGESPHNRYHRADGTVRDVPGTHAPVHPGIWSIHWMESEPMHAIELVEKAKRATTDFGSPPLIRVEIKCLPLP